ncbi:DGQHR domain-containing protein [Martelella sp. FOR1707]
MDPAEEQLLKGRITSDLSQLGRIYKSKSSKFHERNVDHSLVEEYLQEGWEEYGKPLKTKTRLRKLKSHNTQFEDDIWCLLYRLGYRCFNISSDFVLPFGKERTERKQIDVVAVDGDSILLVECKSAERASKPPSLKTEFEALRYRIDGHRKALEQMFGRGRKIKYIFASRNLRIGRDSADAVRLREAGGFLLNDNAYDYVEGLLKAYRDAAHYQFRAMLFKGQDINKDRIEVPAIQGTMGGKTYYMFSLEPDLLLKVGFVLHRTRANEAELPTYQRLLVPSRLKGINRFIEDGGYFPNSIILNFSENKRKVEFQAHNRGDVSRARTGILKFPNAYAVAYIIDGQHRVYGYANTTRKATNTIPVVAFVGLDPAEQLEMFMDINQNQKAVSPTLRITLEEDLYWNSARLDSRIKALRSSIIQRLGSDQTGPLFGKIAIGEDKAALSAKPFADSLVRCGLLPEAKGNRFVSETPNSALYDIGNQDHSVEMQKARNSIVTLINSCYQHAEDFFSDDEPAFERYILNNRGTFAFISLIGSLNAHLISSQVIAPTTSATERFEAISTYLDALFKALVEISKGDKERLLGKLGSGAENTWFKMFQSFVSEAFPIYDPPDLIDWRERQDKELQDSGRQVGTAIERQLKTVVIGNLKAIFGENWDIEIGAIQRECESRAKEQMEKNYKEGLGRKDIPWTDQFFITDYKKIIEKYWSKVPEECPPDFRSFESHFAIDIGHGFNSKAEKLKWLSIFNSYRNNWAHEGTKEKGLNKEEVSFLRDVYQKLVPNRDAPN